MLFLEVLQKREDVQMKLKLFICLLTASAVFSLSAVVVKNETSERIYLSFGKRTSDEPVIPTAKPHPHLTKFNPSFWMEPWEEMETNHIDPLPDEMGIDYQECVDGVVSEHSHSFGNLSKGTTLIISQDAAGHITWVDEIGLLTHK